ncbi:MAG: NAD-dependent epimerase/dehydratase [Rariglobus sp.]|jgi:UDP-glucose 4-epimerase|nr:NAD-dependent epimerase/dehydratase [Rariglobus sp.]
MPLSFTPSETLTKLKVTSLHRVLVTGASGHIGSYYAEHAPAHHVRRLMVRPGHTDGKLLSKWGEVVEANLSDRSRLIEVCQGMDTVIHLAADPSPNAGWNSLLQSNIVGTYNVMSAARMAGVKRVVYASSIHAVSGYPPDVQVKTSEPVNPGDLYGVSKCFGEALGRYFAEQEGMSVIALRIGAFQPLSKAAESHNAGLLDAFVSRRDLHQLIVRCVDDETLQFAIFHGLSNNRFKRLDLSDARALVGYEPRDDLAVENPQFKHTALAEEPETHKGTPQGSKGPWG